VTFGPTASFNFVSDDADVCGVDEAGRGPLAGPVVAAAVILDELQPIRGLNDSKKLTARTRERLFDEIHAKALCFCIAQASVEEITTVPGIGVATARAVLEALGGAPDSEAPAPGIGNDQGRASG